MRHHSFILYSLLYILCSIGTASCSSDDEAMMLPMFSLDQTEITVGADGATETIGVTATVAWSASTDEPWVTLSPANGTGSQQCVVAIDSSLVNGIRTARVRFTADGFPAQTLTVTQTGYDHIIRPDSATLHIQASQRTKEERHFDLSVVTNIAFDITVEYAEGERAWLTPHDTEVTLDHGARPRTTRLRFDWTNNSYPQQRTAKIVFTPRDPSQQLSAPAEVLVTQAAGPLIEDNRQGDSLAIIAIAEALCLYTAWDTNENMSHWSNVRLWERTDKGLPCPEAVGRVRDAQFFLAEYNEETLPAEVRHLRYAESLSFFSNVNSFVKDLSIGTEICTLKHLRSLEVFAWGLDDLPDELTQLGGTLECLKVGGNNFTRIPDVLTKENFPHLRILELHANRRWTTSDLRKKDDSHFEGGIGLWFHTESDNTLRRLLLWDTLEELVLSYNYIEGQIPDFRVGEDGVEAWSQADVDAWGGDTIQWLADNRVPKILPRAERLCLNLNFFTGTLPQWLLYHPHLLDWDPELLIFNQMEYGINSMGQNVRFSNTPTNFEYYYRAFPLYRNKYEIEEEWPEDEPEYRQ